MKCCLDNYYFNTILVISIVITVPGCSSGSFNSRQAPASSAITEEAYNKSLPDDVYPDSRSRRPIVNRDELDAEKKQFMTSALHLKQSHAQVFKDPQVFVYMVAEILKNPRLT